MPKKKRYLLYIISALFLCGLGLLFFLLPSTTPVSESESETRAAGTPREQLALVAHAGGAVSGYVYSNALEALEESAAYGITYIEIDFMPTTDGEIVLTHVWQNMPNRIPGAPNHIVSHETFLSYRLFNRYTTMDLSMLIAFLDEHPDIRVITDTKDGYDAYTALYAIAERYPEHIDRFIPQVYRFEHIGRMERLGFTDIIVTLYLMPAEIFETPEEIARRAFHHGVYAIAIQEYGVTPEFAERLGVWDIRFFAHTVNSPARAEELREMGFYGIYTSHLVYDESAALIPARAPQTDSKLARLEENIQALDDTQRERLADALLYRLDTPVFVRYGEPLLVSHMGTSTPYPSFALGLASPFIHFNTNVLYLPLGNVLTETMTYTWNAEDSILTIGKLELSEGFLFYRSTIFVSQAIIEHLFPYEILRIENYVFVIPVPVEWEAEDLLTLGQSVFGAV